MNRNIGLIFFLLAIVMAFYVLPKSPEFPKPPNDAVQSNEPADIESTDRRGYYTNLTREEIIKHYENEFNVVNGFDIYTPRLNYPPEEAPALIRDQTKSTYLEEIVHPLRESIYINGFEPQTNEYAQYFDGKKWNQKIIVRYVRGPIWVRIFTVFGASMLAYFLILEIKNAKYLKKI